METAELPLHTDERRATTKRILAAALEVFSREGLGATTREIARVAGVNEATVFRQFESKNHLLMAVTREVKRLEAEALGRIDLQNFDLRRDLTHVAEAYYQAIEQHQAFIRTMMAKPADPKLTEQIMREVIEPLRVRFIDYLTEGQRRGLIRDANLAAVVDAFTGMIFAGALRCSIYRPGYSREVFLQTCVELFLQGICQ
jgi:AcrR family transcriptional regulator